MYVSWIDSFHVLAVVNSAAMKMGCRGLFEILIPFPSDKYSGVGLLDHMVILFLVS